MANKANKNGDKDITSYIKEWMFKSYKDETFQQIYKDYQTGLIKKYEDPYFPPNNDSLGQKIVKKFKDLIWRRAPEFIEKVEILNLDVEQKVNQGRIGDCYLLNPIGLLGLIQKNMISRLFTIKEVNQFGYYSVWLFIDGKWQYITVDDSFPWWITRKKPYFCDVVNETQIWPMIIEKAWAKLHGEYSRLWGGDTGLAFRVITGAPTKSYGLKKYRKDPRKKDYVYKQIEYHLSQGHLISVTTGALDDYGKTIMTQGHSYALIGYKKEENKYIIRDPRGPTNVFGKEIYEIDQNELIYLFQCVIVCLLHPDYVFTQHQLLFEDEQQLKHERLFKLKVEKKMKFHLSFFQPNKRFFKMQEKKQKHKLSKMTIKILKIDSKDGQITKAKTISQRNGKFQQMDLEVSLNRGSYYIYCLMEWNSIEHRKINVCAYGQYYVEFLELPSDKKLNQLKEFLEVQRLKKEEQKKYKKNNKQKVNNQNQIKVSNDIDKQDIKQNNLAQKSYQIDEKLLNVNNNTKSQQNNKYQNENENTQKDEVLKLNQNSGNNQKSNKLQNRIQARSDNEIKQFEASEEQNDLENKITQTTEQNNQQVTAITLPSFLSKRNQSKSKTLISQKRYSLNRSQTKALQPSETEALPRYQESQPGNIKNQNKTQQTNKIKSNQQIENNESYNPTTYRVITKQKPSIIIKERRSIRGPLQSISVVKQDANQNQVETQAISPVPQQKIKEQTFKTDIKQQKELNVNKLLPPICQSPQIKNHKINSYQNSKYLSQTEQKVQTKQQNQTINDNKQNSITTTAISSLVVWTQNSNTNTELQIQQQQQQLKNKSFERATPFKSNNNNPVVSSVNLFNQFTEFKSGVSLPLKEKQNQGYSSFSQRTYNKSIGNQLQQIKIMQMQKVNV